MKTHFRSKEITSLPKANDLFREIVNLLSSPGEEPFIEAVPMALFYETSAHDEWAAIEKVADNCWVICGQTHRLDAKTLKLKGFMVHIE